MKNTFAYTLLCSAIRAGLFPKQAYRLTPSEIMAVGRATLPDTQTPFLTRQDLTELEEISK